MANILENPSHRANLGRNGFDMSQRHPFTSSVGHLLPVYYDLLNPGDKIKIGANLFTRTQPLNSSALVRLTEHIEYFFVPMEQIYTLFGSMFYGISDVNSSAFTQGTIKTGEITMPVFKVKDVRDYMIDNWISFDDLVSGKDVMISDLEGQPLLFGALRLTELLGYGYTFFSNQDIDLNRSLPIYLACAYQKIFNDYYRLDDWTSPDRYSYNLDYYDINSFTSDVNVLNAASAFKLRYRPWKKDYFTNVFRNPYFSLSNTSNIGSLNDINFSDVNSLLSSPKGLELPHNLLSQDDSLASVGGNTIPSLSLPMNKLNKLNVTDLRYLYATDKLLRITQFAGKHYNAQTLAHFGKKVPEGVSGEVYYLGGQSQPLVINTIEATATTESESNPDGSVLGQIGAKGYSSTDGKKEFEFEAPCHGVLMAIYSAVPDADYSDERLDYLNTLVYSNDFYKPEFDNLGMEILPKYELSLFPTISVSEAFGCGWRYRYSGLKSKADIVSGAFKYTLRDWVSYRNDVKYIGSPGILGIPSKFMLFTEPYYYIDPSYLDNIFALGFTPSDSEILYESGKGYDYSVIDRANVYKRDPLLHDLYIRCYKTSVMSTYGLPNL